MTMILSFSIFYIKGKFFLPTCVITDVGFRTEIDPVSIIDIHDTHELVKVIDEKIRQGNQRVSDAVRFEKKSAMLSATRLRSWKALEENSLVWEIDRLNRLFRLVPLRREPPRGWVDDVDNIIVLDQQHVAADAVSHILEVIAKC